LRQKIDRTEGILNKLKVILAILVFVFSFSNVYAVTDEEIFRAFSINLATPGARAIGMGGAFIGLADDATAAETNPAGLTILARPEITLQYRYSNGRSVATTIDNIPITNLDGTPTKPIEPVLTANFSANDRMAAINELGFASFVWPFERATFAVSRHELINTDAFLAGSITASPFHHIEPNAFDGRAIISDTNYSFSAGVKLIDQLSIGGSLKVSDFSFESVISAKQKFQPFFGNHFTSTIDSRDTKVGFNLGVMARPHPKLSIGAVYRFEPEFQLDTVVINADRTVGGIPAPLIVEKSVDFDVPDSFGFGISASPVTNLHVNIDVVRVLYSQLENVETGYSLFTHLLPTTGNTNVIDFAIDDGTDVHFGLEYLFEHGDWVHAVRSGYYRQARNRFYLGGAANADVQNFLVPIFGTNPGNDIAHWTVGTGVTHGNFQLDFAVDLSQKDDIDFNDKEEITDGGVDIILSSVFRF